MKSTPEEADKAFDLAGIMGFRLKPDPDQRRMENTRNTTCGE
jgi:hypothetical protein